jgi:hypothetical protein
MVVPPRKPPRSPESDEPADTDGTNP